MHTPFDRRRFLQAGAASYFGLNLPGMLRAAETATAAAQADHLIIIFLNGGPSHLDMWDMKPDAPAEIRGPFGSIATSVPGVRFSEHLPRFAKVMHQGTLIRSAHHSVNNAHAGAVYTALTGHDRGEIGGGTKPTDHPAIGSVMMKERPPTRPVVPYVSMPFITQEGAGGPPQPGFFGGLMGRSFDPLFIRRDPNAADFAMPELSLGADVTQKRIDARKELMKQLQPGIPTEKLLQEMDAFQAKAFDLLTSPATQNAFRIEEEPVKLRDAYGRNIYGQSTLLARRLVEAGTRVACVSWAPDANATWDTHGNNFNKLKDELLPQFDMAASALINDLATRGMLDRTMVAVMGDFGRSPKVNGNAGRDHWNFCYSLMLFGGGFKRGMVYGASDRIGSRPSLNPITPADIIATVYQQLGIPTDLEIVDRQSRPQSLIPWGNPCAELVG